MATARLRQGFCPCGWREGCDNCSNCTGTVKAQVSLSRFEQKLPYDVPPDLEDLSFEGSANLSGTFDGSYTVYSAPNNTVPPGSYIVNGGVSGIKCVARGIDRTTYTGEFESNGYTPCEGVTFYNGECYGGDTYNRVTVIRRTDISRCGGDYSCSKSGCTATELRGQTNSYFGVSFSYTVSANNQFSNISASVYFDNFSSAFGGPVAGVITVSIQGGPTTEVQMKHNGSGYVEIRTVSGNISLSLNRE